MSRLRELSSQSAVKVLSFKGTDSPVVYFLCPSSKRIMRVSDFDLFSCSDLSSCNVQHIQDISLLLDP